ncbi:MAG TPA: C39 family peptidase [Anaerolineaceae bacterium]|nr:C39 family peptidase [Anaerolineaceae bacterium]
MRDLSVLRQRRSWHWPVLAVIAGLGLVGLLIYQIPSIQERVNWKLEIAYTYVRGIVQPIEPMPTVAALESTSFADPALAAALKPTATPALAATQAPPTPTLVLSPTPTLVPTPIPGKVLLPQPAYEKQGINNCGPATLTHYLRYYGWKGDQYTITAVIKPNVDDKNVNVEELVYYARNYAGWLNTEYRVGGNIDLIRKFIAAGIPFMIEEGAPNTISYWPGDDLWAGHYLFIHGYDDTLRVFTAEDTWLGPNRQVPYETLDRNWQAFNRVYIMIYPPDKEDIVKALLGNNWDVDTNRKNALAQAKAETEKDPKNAFAWFNLGSNQVYFEDYTSAARSYDTARQLGLPQRMLRYQFGPFLAYFHSQRTDDLMALTKYSLQITSNSEEALLWRGWGLLRQGKKQDAIDSFNAALKAHPGYQDALYALSFAQNK